jgi:hypothetical protein
MSFKVLFILCSVFLLAAGIIVRLRAHISGRRSQNGS